MFIALISRAFPIFMIGIGSESMVSVLNKGDAIVALKVIKEEDIHVDDIIVFEASGKTIIHRVVEIEEIDGKKYFRTKGDANGTMDNFDTTFELVKGKVKFKIPLLAYPSVKLTELIERIS